jgi:activator of HSP90 ATPase
MEFTLTTTIQAPAKEIYLAWLSSEGHTNMTGADAEISDQAGDSFTAWDGYIEGKNILLEPYRRIVQSWRTSEFEGASDSQVEVLLQEEEGNTILTLIHTQLPADGEQYIKGWQDFYFEPMKTYFAHKNKVS